MSNKLSDMMLASAAQAVSEAAERLHAQLIQRVNTILSACGVKFLQGSTQIYAKPDAIHVISPHDLRFLAQNVDILVGNKDVACDFAALSAVLWGMLQDTEAHLDDILTPPSSSLSSAYAEAVATTKPFHTTNRREADGNTNSLSDAKDSNKKDDKDISTQPTSNTATVAVLPTPSLPSWLSLTEALLPLLTRTTDVAVILRAFELPTARPEVHSAVVSLQPNADLCVHLTRRVTHLLTMQANTEYSARPSAPNNTNASPGSGTNAHESTAGPGGSVQGDALRVGIPDMAVYSLPCHRLFRRTELALSSLLLLLSELTNRSSINARAIVHCVASEEQWRASGYGLLSLESYCAAMQTVMMALLHDRRSEYDNLYSICAQLLLERVARRPPYHVRAFTLLYQRTTLQETNRAGSTAARSARIAANSTNNTYNDDNNNAYNNKKDKSNDKSAHRSDRGDLDSAVAAAERIMTNTARPAELVAMSNASSSSLGRVSSASIGGREDARAISFVGPLLIMRCVQAYVEEMLVPMASTQQQQSSQRRSGSRGRVTGMTALPESADPRITAGLRKAVRQRLYIIERERQLEVSLLNSESSSTTSAGSSKSSHAPSPSASLSALAPTTHTEQTDRCVNERVNRHAQRALLSFHQLLVLAAVCGMPEADLTDDAALIQRANLSHLWQDDGNLSAATAASCSTFTSPSAPCHRTTSMDVISFAPSYPNRLIFPVSYLRLLLACAYTVRSSSGAAPAASHARLSAQSGLALFYAVREHVWQYDRFRAHGVGLSCVYALDALNVTSWLSVVRDAVLYGKDDSADTSLSASVVPALTVGKPDSASEEGDAARSNAINNTNDNYTNDSTGDSASRVPDDSRGEAGTTDTDSTSVTANRNNSTHGSRSEVDGELMHRTDAAAAAPMPTSSMPRRLLAEITATVNAVFAANNTAAEQQHRSTATSTALLSSTAPKNNSRRSNTGTPTEQTMQITTLALVKQMSFFFLAHTASGGDDLLTQHDLPTLLHNLARLYALRVYYPVPLLPQTPIFQQQQQQEQQFSSVSSSDSLSQAMMDPLSRAVVRQEVVALQRRLAQVPQQMPAKEVHDVLMRCLLPHSSEAAVQSSNILQLHLLEAYMRSMATSSAAFAIRDDAMLRHWTAIAMPAATNRRSAALALAAHDFLIAPFLAYRSVSPLFVPTYVSIFVAPQASMLSDSTISNHNNVRASSSNRNSRRSDNHVHAAKYGEPRLEVVKHFSRMVRSSCQGLEQCDATALQQLTLEPGNFAAMGIPLSDAQVETIREVNPTNATLLIVAALFDKLCLLWNRTPEQLNDAHQRFVAYFSALVNLLQCSNSVVLQRVCASIEAIEVEHLRGSGTVQLKFLEYIGGVVDHVRGTTKRGVAEWYLKLRAKVLDENLFQAKM